MVVDGKRQALRRATKLINPTHTDYKRIVVLEAEPLSHDPRMFRKQPPPALIIFWAWSPKPAKVSIGLLEGDGS